MFDWLKAWIKRTTPQPGIPTDLATEYGTLLEHHPVSASEVADISELPGTKEAIKEAIIARCRETKDQHTLRTIKAAFCCLERDSELSSANPP